MKFIDLVSSLPPHVLVNFLYLVSDNFKEVVTATDWVIDHYELHNGDTFYCIYRRIDELEGTKACKAYVIFS